MTIAHSIALAQNYAPVLDEKYKRESLTAILDTPADLVEFTSANTAKIFKTDMQGFGDYSRTSGFNTGNVNSGWETFTLAYDRGRALQVDNMDNEETIGMAFGTLAGEFIRTKEAPEIDSLKSSDIYQ